MEFILYVIISLKCSKSLSFHTNVFCTDQLLYLVFDY